MDNYRVNSQERDQSGFVSSTITEIGSMVINSSKGQFKPILCVSETDVINNAGYPSADYPEVFEAISYVRKAGLRLVCPYGLKSFFGGVHVYSGSAVAFSAGQVDPASFIFTEVNEKYTQQIGVGNGVQTQFSGTTTYKPIVTYSLRALINSTELDLSDDLANTISGDDVSDTGINTIDRTLGVVNFNLAVAPYSGSLVNISYYKAADKSQEISHSFFAASPYTDNLAVDITSTGGKQFSLALYQVVGSSYSHIADYSYSLIKEKDGYGKSLYIQDVFKNDPWLIPVVNTNFQYTTYGVSSLKVALAGGYRQAPTDSNITTGFNYFQQAGKYPVDLFMDVRGGFINTINSIIVNYQPDAHGIGAMSINKGATDLVTERNALALDSDKVSLYCNWALIKDPYNNSEAWISQIGSVGAKYAQMATVYDSAAPAGINEDGLGGQLDDWTYVETDQDFTNSTYLSMLDNAQINPIILDDTYGMMIYGDKTCQVTNSDTSFVGARRAYNYLIKQVKRQILRKQVFKWNDDPHRRKARTMADDFITATLGAVGAFADWYVQCDIFNNTDVIRNQRKFILDIYVKITPTSEFCTIRLTRLSQTTVMAEIIKTA